MSLEAQQLVFRYPGAPGRTLDGVDLGVHAGRLHSVIGPNGSGKSTLLRLLTGVLQPESGRVELGGRPLDQIDRRDRARRVAVVAQSESIAFPLLARELVSMGRYPYLRGLAAERPSDREIVAASLARCDVSHLAERNVQTLSGGELQRVRIARALAQEPDFLLLDEPTSSLDMGHEMAILELLREAADGGMAVLWITHHLGVAGRFSDELTLLSCGQVVAQGAPSDVLRRETLESVYQWPVEVRADASWGSPRITPLRRGEAPPNTPDA